MKFEDGPFENGDGTYRLYPTTESEEDDFIAAALANGWFQTEEQWYEAQSPEVQDEYDAYVQSVMDEAYEGRGPDYDTRYLDGP